MNIEYGKTYHYDEVKDEVRRRQLYILDNVVAICDKYNLTYWLDGGTLLGAVRHKGFIPWDDDIDIGLMRVDYEKLIEILPDELPGDLILQNRQSDRFYQLPFAKVRDKYSQIEEGVTYNGIFIDIFPFDMVPNSSFIKKIQRGSFMLLEAMMVHTDINTLNISKQKGFKAIFLRGAMRTLSFIGQLLGRRAFDPLYKSILGLSSLSPSNDVGDGLTASWAYYKSIRPREVYLPAQKARFVDREYNVPHDIDAYLKTLYGANYMTPIKFDQLHLEQVIFFESKELS